MFEPPNAAQIRIALDEIEPEVWRRLVVPLRWNLEQLHLAIQADFNWWNYHLHEFRIGGLRYGDVELLEEGTFEDDPRTFDDPLLVVPHGAPGIIKAIETWFPRSARQRCLAHRMHNIAAKVSKDQWPEVKARL